MGLPTPNDVHVDAVLTQISIAYTQEEPALADVVFPTIPVSKQSDKYFIYDLGDWNRVAVAPRAPATESEGAGWRLSTDTYYAESYALHKDIAVEERANEDDPLDLDMDAVSYLVQNIKMKRNLKWAQDFFTTSVWTGSTTGSDITPSTKWDQSSATPIKDMRAQIRSMQKKTGRKPNTLVLGANTWDALQDSSDFINRLSDNERKLITREYLARVLEVDRVLVGEMMYNTAAEGATVSTSQMYGDGALLLHVAPRPGKRIPSAGYRYVWQSDGINLQTVRKFFIEAKRCDRVEIQSYWDDKKVGADLGVFFTSTLT